MAIFNLENCLILMRYYSTFIGCQFLATYLVHKGKQEDARTTYTTNINFTFAAVQNL